MEAVAGISTKAGPPRRSCCQEVLPSRTAPCSIVAIGSWGWSCVVNVAGADDSGRRKARIKVRGPQEATDMGWRAKEDEHGIPGDIANTRRALL